LIGEGLNKERIGQAVKKNHVCAPAKGWKVEVATPPAAPVQPAKAPKEYTMGDWFNDLENPHGNR
jgi:hypothetical protein